MSSGNGLITIMEVVIWVSTIIILYKNWHHHCTIYFAGGYYCTVGTIYPTLPCAAGYYCRNSSQSASPSQGDEANQCPVGHYCPEQTTEPIKCPIGTFSNSVLLMNESNCTPCTQGNYFFFFIICFKAVF